MNLFRKLNKILLNIFGNIITRIRNNQYVLVEISMKNRKIEFYDLIYLMEIKIDATHFIKIKRDNWNKLWGQKVDYIEQRSESLKKQNGIQQETIDFFVGVTENCIALINETYSSAIAYTISHERISPKMTTDEFYNPLKFILDVRVRDVSEYIKKTNETDNKITLIRQLIMCKTISTEELVLLFIRMMFPSEFFDQSDSIISEYNGNGLTKNKDLKPENFFEDIKKLYLYLKDIINLPNIEWLN